VVLEGRLALLFKRAMSSQEQEPLYRISKDERWVAPSYRMRRMLRRVCKVHEADTLIDCVRYETYWRRLHPASELKLLLEALVAEHPDGKWPDFLGNEFKLTKDNTLPFILMWEQPLGWYDTR